MLLQDSDFLCGLVNFLNHWYETEPNQTNPYCF